MAAFEERRHKPTGKTYYYVKIRRRGTPPITETFERLTDARIWAADTEAAIRQGRHFPYGEAKRRTVTELIDRYLAEVSPQRPRDERNRSLRLRWWKAELGRMKLAEVTRAVLAAKRDQLLASDVRRQGPDTPARKKSPATVRRYLAALSHVFTIAVKEWGWLEQNELLKISKPSEPRGRTRYLEKGELVSLLKACEGSKNPHLHAIVVLAVSTGMRLGEMLSLRRRDVDCDKGQITLTTTKNGDLRVVPLTGKALELLQARLGPLPHLIHRIDFLHKGLPHGEHLDLVELE